VSTITAADVAAIERRAVADRCAVGRCGYELREALGMPRDETGDEYALWREAIAEVERRSAPPPIAADAGKSDEALVDALIRVVDYDAATCEPEVFAVGVRGQRKGKQVSEMANTKREPIALTRAGTPDVIAYACGACGNVVGGVHRDGDAKARRLAVDCCAPSVCSKCGKPTEKRHRIMCRDCEMDAAWMREAARFAKATVIDAATYDGPVFDESRDEYASSLEEAIEHIEDEDDGMERAFYVYACDVHGLPHLSAERIVSDLCENDMHEEAFDSIVAIDELQAAIDAWHTKQAVKSWMVDYSRVIVLNEDAAAEYRAEYARRVTQEPPRG